MPKQNQKISPKLPFYVSDTHKGWFSHRGVSRCAFVNVQPASESLAQMNEKRRTEVRQAQEDIEEWVRYKKD